MIKEILLTCILIISIGLVNAGEVVTVSGETVYLYGTVDKTIFMKGQVVFAANESHSLNYNKTVCMNSTAIEGQITIINDDAYDLEYNFIADINDSSYITRVVEMKQEVLSSSFISGKILKRTLTIDAIEIANYETKYSWFAGLKDDTFYFSLIDNNIRYGDEVYDNISIAFTQLNYQDQQDMIPETYNAKKMTKHYYRTVGVDSSDDGGLKLSGITGWLYNGIGTIPWSLGDSLQGLLFTPLAIIQYTFNFIFSFLFLIINNWWYAVLLLEIFCIIPALTHTEYPEMVATYIGMHAKIFIFMYHQVILPVVNLIMRIIEIVRNLFRI
jgi:hypothetical protein